MPLPSCSRNRLIWVSKRFLGASSTCATCASQCSGSASCQSVSQYPPSESQPENTAVTTREYPPRAATNTVNKQCWLGNPTSRPVNYSVNKSNMLLCFSQVCGGLQQRERLLQQAERMQVSQTSNIIDDIWCNRAICRQYSVRREIWRLGSDPCHRGVRWFTCPLVAIWPHHTSPPHRII